MSRLQTAVLSSAWGHVSMSQWTLYHHHGQAWTFYSGPVTTSIIPRSHVLWLIFRCSQLSRLCPLTLAVTEHIFSLLTVFISGLVPAWCWSNACVKLWKELERKCAPQTSLRRRKYNIIISKYFLKVYIQCNSQYNLQYTHPCTNTPSIRIFFFTKF